MWGWESERENFKWHVFKAQWGMGYFVTELDGKALCWTCSHPVAVLKEHFIYTGITKLCILHSIPNLQNAVAREIRKFKGISSQQNFFIEIKMKL